jgi:hypothetical protein
MVNVLWSSHSTQRHITPIFSSTTGDQGLVLSKEPRYAPYDIRGIAALLGTHAREFPQPPGLRHPDSPNTPDSVAPPCFSPRRRSTTTGLRSPASCRWHLLNAPRVPLLCALQRSVHIASSPGWHKSAKKEMQCCLVTTANSTVLKNRRKAPYFATDSACSLRRVVRRNLPRLPRLWSIW